MAESDTQVKLFRGGDINGFLSLIVDNMACLSFLAGILIFTFDYPADIVYNYMFPGTAVGVFVGNFFFTILGVKLNKQHKTNKITSMPLGLDAPSAIGLPLTVIGPAFVIMKSNGMAVHEAGMNAWYIGMACVVLIGAFKIASITFADKLRNAIPNAGLLGSLAGVGIALIGFLPLIEVFSEPIVGVVSLGILFYALIAGIRLPKNIPGIFAAIVIGTILYHILGLSGGLSVTYAAPSAKLYINFPYPHLDFLKGMENILPYLPIAVPFAILVTIGDINVTASATEAGDPYKPKSVLLIDGLATVLGGLCGGVSQTTAYVGQPAYKRMGAGQGYTLLGGLFILFGGMFGYISFFVNLIPTAVLAPILIFVSLEIVAQAFIATPKKHFTAVVFAMFPSIARYIAIQMTNPTIVPTDQLKSLTTKIGTTLPETLVTIALGSGFIFVGMLWGGLLAEVIDKRLKRAAVYLFALAIFAFFGIVNSVDIQGGMYFLWNLHGAARATALNFFLGYIVLGIMFFLMSFTRGCKEALAGESATTFAERTLKKIPKKANS